MKNKIKLFVLIFTSNIISNDFLNKSEDNQITQSDIKIFSDQEFNFEEFFDLGVRSGNNNDKKYINYLKKLLSSSNLPFVENIDDFIDTENNITLLMYAADRNLYELTKVLLQLGANPKIKNKAGNTAISYAIARKNEKIIKLIKESFSKPKFNLLGFVKAADGIGQIALNWINVLFPVADVKLIKTRECDFSDIPQYIHPILKTKEKLKSFKDNFYDNAVNIYTDLIWNPHVDNIELMPKSSINYAYSMTEYTEVPSEWVSKINKYFDGVIVPDEFLIDVYKNSGVNVPVFSLPLSPKLTDFLSLPIKQKASKPFVFGCSAVFCKRKNHITLLEAFAKEFGNQKNVILKLHARFGDVESIYNKIKELELSNVEVIFKSLSRHEYVQFMYSLDCYVFISKGEGFSITPREALAAGIPCILTNNTTQKTICNAKVVYSVPANIIESAFIEAANKYIGHDFNCKIEDVTKALRSVYQNYDHYLNIAEKGREWVKQYLNNNLRGKYLNIIKPKKIILGSENIVTNEFLKTNSEVLYKKYLNIMENNVH